MQFCLSSYKIHCKHTKLCYYACQLLFLLMWTCVVSTAGLQVLAHFFLQALLDNVFSKL